MMLIDRVRKFVANPWFYIAVRKYKLISFLYRLVYLPYLVKRLRTNDNITVLFVLYELGAWKTENLYLKMLKHNRFNPQLLLVENLAENYAFKIFSEYLKMKGYNYSILNSNESIQRKLNPDIIFYQKPYVEIMHKNLTFPYNLNSLFCHVEYCFRNRNIPGRRIPYYYYVWQHYVENNSIVSETKMLKVNNSGNMRFTGLPVMDTLLKDKREFIDPWKQIKKKRIIFAPHHTVTTNKLKFTSPFNYATFFVFAEFMLEMVEKYRDSVQWAFKPHPLLRAKLYEIWGKEKTDIYYLKWQELENTQLFEGEYMGLFKHSDAMIHDCGSFKLEYLYTGNPVMYLIKEEQEFDFPNWQTRESLKLHYHGKTQIDIESFIVNVINENDPLRGEREAFVENYLTPPHGKTACDNIIDSILGEQ